MVYWLTEHVQYELKRLNLCGLDAIERDNSVLSVWYLIWLTFHDDSIYLLRTPPPPLIQFINLDVKSEFEKDYKWPLIKFKMRWNFFLFLWQGKNYHEEWIEIPAVFARISPCSSSRSRIEEIITMLCFLANWKRTM